VVKQTRTGCFFAFLLILAARSGAQEYNTVPLDHPAYGIIAIGIARGIIFPPPAAKPWSVHTVKQKLWEMIDDPEQLLSAREEETVLRAIYSLERKKGLEFQDGRYRAEGSGYTFETGLGWESVFAVETSDTAVTSVNKLKLYLGGDVANFASWNVAALGEFLYIERNERRFSPNSPYNIFSVFPFASGRQWDGGVLSLRAPGDYAGWPDDPALAYGLEAELNGVFFNRLLHLRLGRVRRDWGNETNGTSLFLNAYGRPFTALEGTMTPLSWLTVSFLGGALERYREDSRWLKEGPFSDALTAGQIEFNPGKYFHFGIGGAAVYVERPNAAFFVDLELRLPDLFTMWGSLFVDRLNSSSENFFSVNGNSYAYQGGVKTSVLWLPLTAFSLRYTKVEPYCYTAFVSGGESLGYYLPPNSDELLLRFESMILPDIKFHVQFQMIRHGVDYGYGAVPGSSLFDTLAADNSSKYFLTDGVYRWDSVVKLGGSFNLKDGGIPLAIYAETGVVLSSFTINGEAGIGNKADYEPLNDSVYRRGNSFIFSIGFRLFP
jgi:hypothetical protein